METYSKHKRWTNKINGKKITKNSQKVVSYNKNCLIMDNYIAFTDVKYFHCIIISMNNNFIVVVVSDQKTKI